jgi:geranylgeranyl reductase family protein
MSIDFDVCIIGSGPGGSSSAYYLAKQGKKVVLVDKEKFPRRKYCGEAYPVRAQIHLERMGIFKEILDNNQGNWAALGGLISPRGITYIDDSASVIGKHLIIAIKREIADHKMVQAAVREGANFIDGYNVKEVHFSKEENSWTINAFDKEQEPIKARILIAADGAVSKIARALGIIKTTPDAVCTSVYIKAGTHQFKEDGVCLYTRNIHPGYVALFKEANDDLVFCCYVIPGGKYKTTDLEIVHHEFLEEEPFLVNALGPEAEIEPMNAAPLRLGGVKKSYADNLLIVGDAAGQIDPLTGEGLQYAMDAGEMAAETIEEAFKKNDFSSKVLKNYQKKWMKSFGKDFKWSTRMVKVLAKMPIFLDAFAYLCNKKGVDYLIKWAEIMTGSQFKINFFKPRLALPLLWSAIKLKIKKKHI